MRSSLPIAILLGVAACTQPKGDTPDDAGPASASPASETAAAAATSTPEPATLAGAERIVYSSLRPSNWDVFYFATPGEAPERLTDHPGLDYDAVFSADGRWVIFTSERRGNPDLYAIDLIERGEPRLLIDGPGLEDQAAVSPDGRTIAFVSTRDGFTDIFSLPFDPTATQSIDDATNLTGSPGGDFRPAFSPDGRRIVFRSSRNGKFELYLMDRDGSNVRQLTDNDARDNFPVFSPEGDAIAFSSDRDSGVDALGFKTFDNYILELAPDGLPGAVRRLTNDPGQDSHPWYSPDGEWIVYTSEKEGIADEEPMVQEVLFGPQMYGEIYAQRLSDNLTIRLTYNKWEEGNPVWLGAAGSE